MSAAALPPLPTPEKSPAGPAKPAPQARDKVGDSEFDSVSRQERDRLDPKRDSRAEPRAEAARPGERADADARAKEPASGQVQKTGTDKPGVATESGKVITAAAGESLQAPAEPELVFTFAQLQDLVVLEPEALPVGITGQGSLPGAAMTMTGLAGAGTLPGQSPASAMGPGQGMAGLNAKVGQDSAGRLLAEGVMAQLSGDGGKSPEASLSAGLGRFQGALEVAGQSQLVNPGQKVPDAMVPLRGYATSVELPVSHAEWGDKLVGKLAWLTSQKMSMAEIHLTPPDMGPLEVRVQVQNDQANVTIHAANPAVRDQLELHSHRLRDMLNGQGLDLQNFDVSDAPDRRGADTDDRDGHQAGGGQGLAGGTDEPELVEAGGSLDLTWRGEVDLYA